MQGSPSPIRSQAPLGRRSSVGSADGLPAWVFRHRGDLQGLRAVAVLLVVLDHAGVPFLRGGYVGVDVFFVLSGFLITGLLVSQAARRGYVSLAEFYVRRARRILPAAALTLAVTDIAAGQLLNFVRARQAETDSIWASLFAANIRFAREGSSYFAQGQPLSPVQHFWTLAVEEQFYLAWPVVLSLALFGVAFARRRPRVLTRRALRRCLAVVVVAGLASLAWSVHSTAASPTTAYFSTFARAWELALGAGLALAASSLARLPAWLRLASGWVGLICVALAGVLFSGGTAFPGYAALLPTLGAALVIGAGARPQQSRASVGRVLAVAPLRWLGDRSYALYLWHWPVLIIATQYAGHDLSAGVNLLLLFGALILAAASYAIFEHPIRQMRWRAPRGLLLWPASAAVVLAFAVPTLASIDATATRIDVASAAVRPTVLLDPASATIAATTAPKPLPAVVAAATAAERGAPLPVPLTPAVGDLLGDFYTFPAGCSPGRADTSSNVCRLGDATAAKTIVVFGDSHAQMWMPAILSMAATDSWVVVPFVKDGCIPRTWPGTTSACSTWYRWATGSASALHPDVTLIIGSWAATGAPGRAVKPIASLSSMMKRFSASVIVVGDAPGQSRNPVDCLLAAGATMKTCAATPTALQLKTDDQIAANAAASGIGFMSTRGWFCARPSGTPSDYLCPMVVNRTITCVDRGHISQTYALELVPPFRAAFRRQLFR